MTARTALCLALLLTFTPLARAAPPANDDRGSATAVAAFPLAWTDERGTAGATVEPGEPLPCGTMGSTVWYRMDLLGGAYGHVNVDTHRSDYHTIVAVYEETPAGLALVECSWGSSWGLRGEINFRPALGSTYLIQVGGWRNATGTLRLDVGHWIPF